MEEREHAEHEHPPKEPHRVHVGCRRQPPGDEQFFFFYNDAPPTEIYTSSHTLSLHDALPISSRTSPWMPPTPSSTRAVARASSRDGPGRDRKSTRLNSSHVSLSRMPSSA